MTYLQFYLMNFSGQYPKCQCGAVRCGAVPVVLQWNRGEFILGQQRQRGWCPVGRGEFLYTSAPPPTPQWAWRALEGIRRPKWSSEGLGWVRVLVGFKSLADFEDWWMVIWKFSPVYSRAWVSPAIAGTGPSISILPSKKAVRRAGGLFFRNGVIVRPFKK